MHIYAYAFIIKMPSRRIHTKFFGKISNLFSLCLNETFLHMFEKFIHKRHFKRLPGILKRNRLGPSSCYIGGRESARPLAQQAIFVKSAMEPPFPESGKALPVARPFPGDLSYPYLTCCKPLDILWNACYHRAVVSRC